MAIQKRILQFDSNKKIEDIIITAYLLAYNVTNERIEGLKWEITANRSYKY